MATKKGWRNKIDWDLDIKEPAMLIAYKSSQSDDGWECPHCGERNQLGFECGIGNDDYINLTFNNEKIEMFCSSCNEKFWLKAFTVIKYETSTDENFDGE